MVDKEYLIDLINKSNKITLLVPGDDDGSVLKAIEVELNDISLIEDELILCHNPGTWEI